MALSDVERKTLTRVVGRCRTLLQDEVRDQLERIYGFTREGAPRPLEGLPPSSVERGVAAELREWHRHLAGTAPGTSEARQRAALNRMAEETAFTVLHRLAALRMAEERGVLQPCVRDGLRSDGFRLYLQFAGGASGATKRPTGSSWSGCSTRSPRICQPCSTGASHARWCFRGRAAWRRWSAS